MCSASKQVRDQYENTRAEFEKEIDFCQQLNYKFRSNSYLENRKLYDFEEQRIRRQQNTQLQQLGDESQEITELTQELTPQSEQDSRIAETVRTEVKKKYISQLCELHILF